MCCPRGNCKAAWFNDLTASVFRSPTQYRHIFQRQNDKYATFLTCVPRRHTLATLFGYSFISHSFFLCKCIVGNLCCFDSLSLRYNFQVCTQSCTDYCLDKRQGNIEVMYIYVKWFIFQNKVSCKMKKKALTLLLITLFILLFSLTEVCWIYYYNIFPKHIS